MFSFRSKVIKVLKEHFLYKPTSPLQRPILDGIILQAKRKGGNEYDAAIMFMMVQMNSLEGTGPDVQSFIGTHANNIRRILSLARSDYSEITSLLSEIEEKSQSTVLAADSIQSPDKLHLYQSSDFHRLLNFAKEKHPSYPKERETIATAKGRSQVNWTAWILLGAVFLIMTVISSSH